MDAIAKRTLELRTATGSIEVVVALGRPEQVAEDEWKCVWEVTYAGDTKSRPAIGGDSMQALQLAMVTLDVELEQGAKRRSGRLFHLDEPFTSVLENSGMQKKPPSTATPSGGAA